VSKAHNRGFKLSLELKATAEGRGWGGTWLPAARGDCEQCAWRNSCSAGRMACVRLQALLSSSTAVFKTVLCCDSLCRLARRSPRACLEWPRPRRACARTRPAGSSPSSQTCALTPACSLVGVMPKLLWPPLHQPRAPAAVHMCMTRARVRRVRSVGSVCAAALSFRRSPVRRALAAR